MIYFQLLYSFLKIGFFGFGGGYAMLSLVQNEIVENRNWVSAEQFTDIVAISQMMPGPVAINSATYVGYLVTGNVLGAIIATFAVCVPPLTIMIVITKFYMRLRDNSYVEFVISGLKPMIIGMIGAAAVMLSTPSNFTNVASIAIFAGCLIAAIMKVNPILLIALSAVAGLIIW